MRIAVTGAEGFIGSWLVKELRSRGHDVRPWAAPELRHHRPWVTAGGRPLDVLVHCAAVVGRVAGDTDPCETASINAGLTALLARECAERGVRFVYVSSSEVYGPAVMWATETSPCYFCGDGQVGYFADHLPHNLYGLSKRWGEEAARLYAPDGLQILRLSMPYGPGHHPGSGRAAMTNFLWNAITGKQITVHRGAARSWCWIGDTVRAIALVLEDGGQGAWNIGRDDNETPMLNVARRALVLTCGYVIDRRIRLVDPPEGFTVAKRLSTARLQALGWRPEVELEEGMNLTLEWLRAARLSLLAR